MTAPAITTLGKLGIGASSSLTQRLDFTDFDLGIEVEMKDMNGTRGKYNRDSARIRPNLIRLHPRLRCQPTGVELASMLQWILGGTPSSGSYGLGDAPYPQTVGFDPNTGAMWTLTGVVVDEARFRAQQGEPLDLDLQLVGQSYTTNGTFPGALALDVSTQPFLFSDCVLQIGSTAGVQARGFELAIQNGIDKNRFFNSATLTAASRLTRRITCSVDVPYGVYQSLFLTGEYMPVAVSATFGYTNPISGHAAQLVFSLPGVRFTPKSPQSHAQQEVMLPLEGEALSPDGTTDPLTVTLTTGA